LEETALNPIDPSFAKPLFWTAINEISDM
jgi:hypothetical protein